MLKVCRRKNKKSKFRIVIYLDVTLNVNGGTLTKKLTNLLILLSICQTSIEKRHSNNSFDEKIFKQSAI